MAVRGEGRVFASAARATEATGVYGRPTLATVSHKKSLTMSGLFKYGGEGGIRTLEALRPTHFPGVLLRPLGHLTNNL